jgi:hypothetical protein
MSVTVNNLTVSTNVAFDNQSLTIALNIEDIPLSDSYECSIGNTVPSNDELFYVQRDGSFLWSLHSNHTTVPVSSIT